MNVKMVLADGHASSAGSNVARVQPMPTQQFTILNQVSSSMPSGSNPKGTNPIKMGQKYIRSTVNCNGVLKTVLVPVGDNEGTRTIVPAAGLSQEAALAAARIPLPPSAGKAKTHKSATAASKRVFACTTEGTSAQKMSNLSVAVPGQTGSCTVQKHNAASGSEAGKSILIPIGTTYGPGQKFVIPSSRNTSTSSPIILQLQPSTSSVTSSPSTVLSTISSTASKTHCRNPLLDTLLKQDDTYIYKPASILPRIGILLDSRKVQQNNDFVPHAQDTTINSQPVNSLSGPRISPLTAGLSLVTQRVTTVQNSTSRPITSATVQAPVETTARPKPLTIGTLKSITPPTTAQNQTILVAYPKPSNATNGTPVTHSKLNVNSSRSLTQATTLQGSSSDAPYNIIVKNLTSVPDATAKLGPAQLILPTDHSSPGFNSRVPLKSILKSTSTGNIIVSDCEPKVINIGDSDSQLRIDSVFSLHEQSEFATVLQEEEDDIPMMDEESLNNMKIIEIVPDDDYQQPHTTNTESCNDLNKQISAGGSVEQTDAQLGLKEAIEDSSQCKDHYRTETCNDLDRQTNAGGSIDQTDASLVLKDAIEDSSQCQDHYQTESCNDLDRHTHAGGSVDQTDAPLGLKDAIEDSSQRQDDYKTELCNDLDKQTNTGSSVDETDKALCLKDSIEYPSQCQDDEDVLRGDNMQVLIAHQAARQMQGLSENSVVEGDSTDTTTSDGALDFRSLLTRPKEEIQSEPSCLATVESTTPSTKVPVESKTGLKIPCRAPRKVKSPLLAFRKADKKYLLNFPEMKHCVVKLRNMYLGGENTIKGNQRGVRPGKRKSQWTKKKKSTKLSSTGSTGTAPSPLKVCLAKSEPKSATGRRPEELSQAKSDKASKGAIGSRLEAAQAKLLNALRKQSVSLSSLSPQVRPSSILSTTAMQPKPIVSQAAPILLRSQGSTPRLAFARPVDQNSTSKNKFFLVKTSTGAFLVPVNQENNKLAQSIQSRRDLSQENLRSLLKPITGIARVASGLSTSTTLAVGKPNTLATSVVQTTPGQIVNNMTTTEATSLPKSMATIVHRQPSNIAASKSKTTVVYTQAKRDSKTLQGTRNKCSTIVYPVEKKIATQQLPAIQVVSTIKQEPTNLIESSQPRKRAVQKEWIDLENGGPIAKVPQEETPSPPKENSLDRIKRLRESLLKQNEQLAKIRKEREESKKALEEIEKDD